MTEHGHSTYTNHRCRCEVCRTANRDYHRAARARKLAAIRAGTLTVVHGQSTYINCGCRCDVCRSAASAANRANRARRSM